MIKQILFLVTFLSSSFLAELHAEEKVKFTNTPTVASEYTIIIEGYDWGPAVSKVVLPYNENLSNPDYQNYAVEVERSTDCTDISAGQASGSRKVVYAYVSDGDGNVAAQGKNITLVLEVAPNLPLSSPILYTRNDRCSGNNWINYEMTVTDKKTDQTWDTEANRIMPLIDRFDLSGKYTHEDVTLTYASYEPESSEEKQPLIIWLHGGGEGGTDPSIPLIANKAANYASDDIQVFFGGAHVLVPQTPTRWMDAGEGNSTRGNTNDIYNEALMGLFRQYMEENPNIDQDRIYLGGCSNGGYMTLKLLLLHTDFFAAAFPSALAYNSEYLTDAQVESIKDKPIWFVHSQDDSTTVAIETAIPVYKRLKAAGAENVYMSLYDHVVDITGFFGGEDFHYPGHWSWIYSHANECRKDADGSWVTLNERPTTIMEWLAAQRK